MSPQRNIMSMTIQNIEWSDDSARKARPCFQCKTPTTGRVGRQPKCMKCTMAEALAPLQAVIGALRGKV